MEVPIDGNSKPYATRVRALKDVTLMIQAGMYGRPESSTVDQPA